VLGLDDWLRMLGLHSHMGRRFLRRRLPRWLLRIQFALQLPQSGESVGVEVDVGTRTVGSPPQSPQFVHLGP
jgi:hypothetical protein